MEKSAGSISGIFVGAASHNDDEDELYDEASEDDFAEFDIDDDEEQPKPKVKGSKFLTSY